MQFDKIDIKMLLRGFIAELAKCHANLREAFSPHFDEAAAEITEVYALVSKAKGCDVKHVSVFDETNADDPISTYLRLSNIEQCSAYKVRWRGLQTAQQRFVSSEPVQQDDTFFQTGGDIWISK
ncbi:MAG: hypothetical protein CFE33_19745 [Pseudorhodobacter sp. PARRP1]|nr:MAG: hypothetical protein CFE33_19745 [Pseudorhodobacter sp. PARRP1]